MAAGKPKSTKASVGCLMLFALPFAAVGVGAFVWGVSDVLAWHRMSGWIAVSAHVLAVDLEEHHDDDGTTYETTATYQYDYAGHGYTSTRVGIGTGADNIGDFQHRIFRQLSAARDGGAAVSAYIDPADPSDAVLNRELRLGFLAFKGLFALVFGGVGFGILFAARYGGRKLAAEEARQTQFPDEPWRWRPEWDHGRIASSTRTAAYAAIGFALLWNLISLPALAFVPREIARGNTLAIVALLFPLVGAGLAVWAIRAWLRFKRFKIATLTLQRVPVALGGRLKGSLRVEAEVPVAADFRLELTCTEERVTGSGKNRNRSERLLWQKEWRAPRHQCQISSTFTSIPVDVAVPADQLATTMGDTMPKISWRLEATGECAGPDFWSRFELPVFAGATSPSATEPSAAPPPPSPSERPAEPALAALGIRYERLPQGGEAWTFARGRHKGVALAITAFSAVFATAAAIVFTTNAPLVIPIVFALVDTLLVTWALSLWLTEYRVTLDRGVLTLLRSGFLSRAPIEIPTQWIRGVRAKRGMQAGNKLYYDLKVETTDGTHTAAGSIADYDVATWLAQHWTTGGARTQAGA